MSTALHVLVSGLENSRVYLLHKSNILFNVNKDDRIMFSSTMFSEVLFAQSNFSRSFIATS
jgi:hypothetical protein